LPSEKLNDKEMEKKFRNPDDADAYYNRSNAKFTLADYQGAIADYTKAIECDNTYIVSP
jgi:tetratricopeptide (TPR) repeat protein